MNTKSRIQNRRYKMLSSMALCAILLATGLGLAPRPISPTELLEKGIYTEETKGELKAAAAIYQQIVQDPNADRSLLAQAQLRLGLCELKLGNKPQAISALERLTEQFPDKDKLLAVVGQQIPQLLEEIVQQIEQNYLEEVDRTDLLETAIRAIVGKLDERSGLLRPNDLEFLGAEETAQLQASIDQKIVGVGAILRLDKETGQVVVTGVLPGSPALRGGLAAGDRILKINGGDLPAEETLPAAVKLIRGAPGTSVVLGVQRAGSDDLVNLSLLRAAIRVPSVKGDHTRPDHTSEFMLDDSARIGYIRLSEVGKESSQEMQAALTELQGRGMKGLILDLRNNPGGLLDQAVAIADLFVESGRILTVKGRSGEQAFDATEEGTFSGFPMALLVNRNTASAAEIIAACLQDHQRALVVGERTFGQGIVRSILPLKDQIGSLKLPVASYFRPSGKTMNRYPGSQESDDWGVKPDAGYAMVLPEDEVKALAQERSVRENLHPADASGPAPLDRQLDKAKQYLMEQLRNGGATPPAR